MFGSSRFRSSLVLHVVETRVIDMIKTLQWIVNLTIKDCLDKFAYAPVLAMCYTSMACAYIFYKEYIFDTLKDK